jgi:hypothetical protein
MIKLVDLFLKKSDMKATATINGEVHELSMPIGGNDPYEEPVKSIKEQQYYYFCHVIDKIIDNKQYALTVVSKFDMKRYYEFVNPRENDIVYRLVDVSSVGLDGNGKIICGWHNRLEVDEVRMKGTGGFWDQVLDTTIYFKNETKSNKTYEVKPQNLNNILRDNLLVCEKNVTIDLEGEFVECINLIADFTRKNDTTYPYAKISEEIAKFDNMRTAIGVVSNIFPVGKSFKLAQQMINYIAEIISGSSLILPAKEFYNLRGPVKISQITKDIYESSIGQTGDLYYYKNKKKSNKKSDHVEIYY